MSRAERRSFEIQEHKEAIYNRDDGFCRSCGEKVPWPGECAHIVPKSRANALRYGPMMIETLISCGIRINPLKSVESYGLEALNLSDNLALTHHGECNDAQLIGASLIEADVHMQHVLEVFEMEHTTHAAVQV